MASNRNRSEDTIFVYYINEHFNGYYRFSNILREKLP